MKKKLLGNLYTTDSSDPKRFVTSCDVNVLNSKDIKVSSLYHYFFLLSSLSIILLLSLDSQTTNFTFYIFLTKFQRNHSCRNL